MNEIRM